MSTQWRFVASSESGNNGIDSLLLKLSVNAPFIAVIASLVLLLGQFGVYALLHRDLYPRKQNIYRGTRSAILSLNILRLVSCVTLFALQISVGKSIDSRLQTGLWIAYAYSSILALSTVLRPIKFVTKHLIAVLALCWVIFAYRNIWPLATYKLLPADRAEGAMLWIKGAILAVGAVVVPLVIPHELVFRLEKKMDEKPNPEQTASLLARLFFAYMDRFVLKAYRAPKFTTDQLPPLCEDDETEVLMARAYPILDPLQNKSNRHIFFGLLRVFMWEHLEEIYLLVIMVLADFMQPLGINRLLAYVESNGRDAYVRPWFWCLFLFVGQISLSLISGRYMIIMGRIIARTQGVVTQLIFDHSLRVRAFSADASKKPAVAVSAAASTSAGGDDETTLNAESSTAPSIDQSATTVVEEVVEPAEKSSSTSMGTLNNLIATDVANIDEGQYWILTGFYTPFQIVVSIVFLYVVLDWSAIVGVITMLILLPMPGWVAKYSHGIQVKRMQKSDARVETVTEVMSGAIRMVKLSGWETQMVERIDHQRQEEITVLRKYKLVSVVTTIMNQLILIATMVATFATFTIVMKRSMTASRVFSSITVFQWLQGHFRGVSDQLPGLINAKVSLDRINNFLKNTDLISTPSVDPSTPADIQAHSPEVIGIRSASFTWSLPSSSSGSSTPSRPRYKLTIDGQVTFQPGKINLIIGQTGSGKTSMLMALLGEMHYHPEGVDSFVGLPRGGGVAYQAQESWILNETIRDNILFGSVYQEDRYKKVIRQCALESDLALFKAGDQTEVGERGVTLSGGQKARVTLARAVYSNAEIILLDDVFAALDTHTAQWVVKECLQGELVKGRTVILATHSLSLVSPIAHFVVSLTPDGRINSQGSLESALEKDHSLIEADTEKVKVESTDKPETVEEETEEQKKLAEDGKLVTEEETAEGHVGWHAVKLLLVNMASTSPGRLLFWVSFLLLTIAFHATSIWYIWALGRWAKQYEDHAPTDVPVVYYLAMYLAIIALHVSAAAAKNVVFVLGSLRSSQVIHRLLVESVLRSTLRWLDRTPSSRIIARCTQDISSIDGPVASYFTGLADITAVIVLRFITIIVMSPLYFIPSLVISLVVAWVGQIYIKAQLAVKREMSNARSPILGHFGAAVTGIVSLRAYGAQAAFHLESMKRVNRWTRAARTFSNLNKWVSIRSEALTALFNAGLAAYLVYGSSLDASAIGFTLSMSVVFSNLIIWWVKYFNEFQVNGNSLERIQQYLEIEHEPAPTPQGVPPAYWPASGHLKVEKLSSRYSENGPSVLREISFEVKSGERVGIVGRTGSGKSSLTLALLRCILTEGKVYFDGIATDTVNLDALRSAITIIPQVPELLSGTLRENIDPFSQHEDVYLNEVMGAAGLFSLDRDKFGEKLSLDSPISSAGKNLSVGQRQMIALARAMVRRSRLLILDEATSAIDYETDSIIQASLRKEVAKDVSVLTIAHRLHTIMDSDKILVLDAGRIVEFGRPQDLLQQPNSTLRALVDASPDKAQLLAKVAAA
ncbi:multidrug resistance-associated ABC transporter [Trametopsis cervina]|nr:multidrug resistance-associated ABC transporter [Trametopsis cervina]